jgi:hypothetical protein
MAYDEGMAQIMRDTLSETSGVDEKKMFGGICFMLNGNMLCGVHKDGGMFRVGKDNETAALAVEGAGPLTFTKRKMGGMVDVTDAAIGNDDSRDQLMALAMDFVGGLPAK